MLKAGVAGVGEASCGAGMVAVRVVCAAPGVSVAGIREEVEIAGAVVTAGGVAGPPNWHPASKRMHRQKSQRCFICSPGMRMVDI
jgi:hypothetical protein